MAEEIKENAAAGEESSENKPVRGYEPHGSASAPRPGDRKAGDHHGRPSERRGGRGGFRGARRPEDDFQERVVAINRISKTVAGGKHVRFSALVVIGDGKGHYGMALSKSGEVPDAIKKALAKARKQIYTIELKNGTLAHDIVGEYGATKVIIKPAPAGTGLVAGGAVRAILELAGVKNAVSKVYGSRTSVNVIHAAHAALSSLKQYDRVMVLRGLKSEEQIKAMHEAQKAKAAPKAEAKPVANGGNQQ